MTPEEARARLKNKGRDLTRKERKALNTIAGMRTEYAIEHQHIPGGQWHQVTRWSHEPPLNDDDALAPDERVVRRYVTGPQPLGEEEK